MYIYHALISALSARVIHINLNAIFCTHVEHSPTKAVYIKYYMENKHTNKQTNTHTHTHTRTHAQTNKQTNKQTHKQTHTHSLTL